MKNVAEQGGSPDRIDNIPSLGLTRRQFLGTGAAAIAAGLLATPRGQLAGDVVLEHWHPATPPLAEGDVSPDYKGVVELYGSLVHGFETPNGLLLAERDSWRISAFWPHTIAVRAAATGRKLPGALGEHFRTTYDRYYGAMEHYWYDGGPGHSMYLPHVTPTSDTRPDHLAFYNDDNGWGADLLLQHSHETGDTVALQRTQEIVALQLSQWNDLIGGVPWRHDPGNDTSEVLVANDPVVILCAKLYQQTCNPIYYHPEGGSAPDCAEIYRWTCMNLQSPNHLFYDGRSEQVVSNQEYSYDQGMAVGAALAMHRLDPVDYPIDDAVAIANAALSAFDYVHARMDAPEVPLELGNSAENAIFFEQLLDLSAALPDTWENQRLHARIIQALHLTYARQTVLQPNYNYTDVLQQAGALYLAVLASVHPLAT